MEHRKQMTDKNREGDTRECHFGEAKLQREFLRQPHRKPALARIAYEREQGGPFFACPQHIGGTGVAGAVAVRVGEAEKFAHDHGERDRADKVSANNGNH